MKTSKIAAFCFVFLLGSMSPKNAAALYTDDGSAEAAPQGGGGAPEEAPAAPAEDTSSPATEAPAESSGSGHCGRGRRRFKILVKVKAQKAGKGHKSRRAYKKWVAGCGAVVEEPPPAPEAAPEAPPAESSGSGHCGRGLRRVKVLVKVKAQKGRKAYKRWVAGCGSADQGAVTADTLSPGELPPLPENAPEGAPIELEGTAELPPLPENAPEGPPIELEGTAELPPLPENAPEGPPIELEGTAELPPKAPEEGLPPKEFEEGLPPKEFEEGLPPKEPEEGLPPKELEPFPGDETSDAAPAPCPGHMRRYKILVKVKARKAVKAQKGRKAQKARRAYAKYLSGCGSPAPAQDGGGAAEETPAPPAPSAEATPAPSAEARRRPRRSTPAPSAEATPAPPDAAPAEEAAGPCPKRMRRVKILVRVKAQKGAKGQKARKGYKRWVAGCGAADQSGTGANILTPEEIEDIKESPENALNSGPQQTTGIDPDIANSEENALNNGSQQPADSEPPHLTGPGLPGIYLGDSPDSIPPAGGGQAAPPGQAPMSEGVGPAPAQGPGQDADQGQGAWPQAQGPGESAPAQGPQGETVLGQEGNSGGGTAGGGATASLCDKYGHCLEAFSNGNSKVNLSDLDEGLGEKTITVLPPPSVPGVPVGPAGPQGGDEQETQGYTPSETQGYTPSETQSYAETETPSYTPNYNTPNYNTPSYTPPMPDARAPEPDQPVVGNRACQALPRAQQAAVKACPTIDSSCDSVKDRGLQAMLTQVRRSCAAAQQKAQQLQSQCPDGDLGSQGTPEVLRCAQAPVEKDPNKNPQPGQGAQAPGKGQPGPGTGLPGAPGQGKGPPGTPGEQGGNQQGSNARNPGLPGAGRTVAPGNGQLQGPRQRQLAPDFSLAGLDGQTIDLSTYTGKVVLLFFWVEWSAPSKDEAKRLTGMYARYKDRGFVVVAVNMSEGDTRALAYARTLPYPVVNAGEAWSLEEGGNPYGATVTPTSFLLDRRGRVALSWEGDLTDQSQVKLRAALEKLLKEPAPPAAAPATKARRRSRR